MDWEFRKREEKYLTEKKAAGVIDPVGSSVVPFASGLIPEQNSAANGCELFSFLSMTLGLPV